MAIQLQPNETNIWRIVQAIIQLVEGRHNASGSVTLAPGAATTVVSHPNCSKDCQPQLQARSLSAAAEVGAGTVYVSAISQGSFTITHANSGVADRLFGYTVTGG
jgi:hypothetical protein